MGRGSVAGGSGGEYFIGDFDGTKFTCDHDINKSYWVDYGRDFYAPVSWSDIPGSDGRRIWIGWMNNWETSLVPTAPWRSAMSIPRVLSLRKTKNGLRMVQQPVKELEQLRGDKQSLEEMSVDGIINLKKHNISGGRFELIAEFDLKNSKRVGFEVRSGGTEKTIIGYDADSSELFVDRVKSGNVSFHQKFPGIHKGPLLVNNDDTISMRFFVDESSVEVFGNGGVTVITDRLFPSSTSNGISVFSEGGPAKLKRLEFWPMNSVWRK